MRVRDLGQILVSALMALAAISIIAPRVSLASDETPSGVHRDAVPGGTQPPSGSGIVQESYSGVLIGPLVVGFTKEFLASSDQREHRIRGSDVEKMQRHYREVVGSKLGSDYTISESPGPGVVRADAYLIDHVLDKSDWLAPAATSTFRTAPRVRVVVFLRDSRSDELVDSVGMTLAPHGDRLMRDTPGFYWDYMRQVFDRIATRMIWALEKRAAEPQAVEALADGLVEAGPR